MRFQDRTAIVGDDGCETNALDQTLPPEEQDIFVVHACIGKLAPGRSPTSVAASFQWRQIHRNQPKELIGRQLPAFDHVAQPPPYDSSNS